MINPTERKYLQYLPPYLRRRYVSLKKRLGYVGREYSLQPFESLGCIFVHIPKTGGVSISKALFGNLAGGHCDVSDYRFLFGDEAYESMFSFAFVRDPFTRLASAYWFLKQGGITEQDRVWAANNLAEYDSLNEFVRGWIRDQDVNKSLHFCEQNQFVAGNDTVDVDFVGKVETIQEDFETLKNRIGTNASLQHLNKSNSKGYDNVYDAESQYIIKEVYRKDFNIFRYK